jgi:hypothetical protein
MRHTLRFHALFLWFALFVITQANAETASRQEMREVCLAWLDHRGAVPQGWSGSPSPGIVAEQPITQDDVLLGCAFQIAPQGMVVVPARKELCPVQFFSETGWIDFSTDQEVVAQVLRGRLALMTGIVTGKAGVLDSGRSHLVSAASEANRARWARMTAKTSEWMGERAAPADGVGPLLSTSWHQGPPYNLFCPIGRDGVRCVAGCTPVAAAQIARYHAFPPHGGVGEAELAWNGDDCGIPPSEGALLHADFRNPYDWDRMPNAFLSSRGGEGDSAAAELCYELGVGGYTDYGTSCGSNASLPALVNTLQAHFGYDLSARGIYRSQAADAHEWFTIMQDEINERRPVLYSFVYRQSQDGHALVCDGWRIDAGIEYLSLNLGGGGVTGWFAADDNGMSYPLQDEAVVRLSPPHPEVVAPDGGMDFPDVQAALDAARDGDTIELLDGVFRGPGNRDLDCGGKQVTIRSRSDDPALCVIDCEGSAVSPHRAFTFSHGEDLSTVVQGITMRNGYVSSRDGTDAAPGGAVLCEGTASPRFVNCVLARNEAGQGGAIGCTGSASPQIEGCVFWKNTARQGGALAKTGAGSVRIYASTFYGNSAETGGGLYGGSPNALLLGGSIVANSLAGSAIALAAGASARLSCTDLFANTGGDWTGAIGSQANREGNAWANPKFCDAEAGNLDLDAASDCANSWCGLMGARPVGCRQTEYYVGAGPQYEYKTIAEALAVARDGERIILVDSLYTGNGNRDLVIPRRGLIIESGALDPSTCVLDLEAGPGKPHRAFRVDGMNGVTFRGITVRHGWASFGGAIYIASADSTRILDCAFQECTATGWPSSSGGAVSIRGAGALGGRNTIRGCRFESCRAVADGGAVSFWHEASPDTSFVENCEFSSDSAGSEGGALAGWMTRVRVRNSVFRSNAALNGGAVGMDGESHLWLESSTLAGNAATISGGSVCIQGKNTVGYFQNSIFASETAAPPIECSSTFGTMVMVTCCDVWPQDSGTWTGCLAGWDTDNLLVDPQFCAPQGGDYRLSAASPCVAGLPANLDCGPIGALPVGCEATKPPDGAEDVLSFRRLVPNPFRHEIRIDYVVPARAAAGSLDISIYDAAGRLVRTVFRGTGGAGDQFAIWDGLDSAGRRVGSGVFFCRLRAGTEEVGRRVIVIR